MPLAPTDIETDTGTGTHLADSDASNGGACEDGGWGEEEEEDGQDAVAQPQVQQEKAAGLPRLLFCVSEKMMLLDAQMVRLSIKRPFGIMVGVGGDLFCENKCEDNVEVEEKANESEQGEDQSKNQLQQMNFEN